MSQNYVNTNQKSRLAASFNGEQGPTTERIKSELQNMQQQIRFLQWQAKEYDQVKIDPACFNSFSGPRALKPTSA